MTFRLLHLICNSQEHAKHFFKFMIDKETEKQHKSDKNHIPKQIEPSKDIPYAYVTFKHQDCILLGNHINSDESTPVLPTVLNQLQQQKSSIKKLITLFNINHHTMIASHTHSNWITSKKLKLFDELGINQTILYFNPTALEHTMHLLPASLLFEPTLPSSRTHLQF